MRIVYRAFSLKLPLAIACLVSLLYGTQLQAQTTSQLPSPTAHLNDFAGVVDAQTKGRLESILLNIKDKTKVEFYIATVDSTDGVDIFDFSRKLSSDWNIGSRNSGTRSLLLVISVGSKTSFTQFSKAVQPVLPEGILGEMTQRMRAPLASGRFTEAIDQSVNLFASALAQKLGLVADELMNPTPSAEAVKVADTSSETQSQANETPRTRPRVVKENSKPAEIEKPSESVATEVKPTTENTQPTTTTTDVKPPTTEEIKPTETKPAPKTSSTPKNSTKSTKTNANAKVAEPEPVDDEAEAEEVELTLTLPLAKRAEKLKAFLATHPDSKARPRATELLISTHAGLGDQYLKKGDIENGTRQLMQVIDEADVNISDQLFLGVVSQIPSNFYLRGQSDSAMKAAGNIEAKFGNTAQRLLAVAGFYLGLERGDEAARIAEQAVKLAPDLAEAHRVLALSRHINLQLDEAAAEYKRTVELDPKSKVSRSSLADLTRASGKPEEALALYNELLQADSKDLTATTGKVICLFDLGRKEEANSALEAALATEPRNLSLLAGMAYWYAAHEEYEKAFDFARRAIAVEPRYTWSQIALVRSLIGMKRPVGAERAMRYARQYGKFPTLNYELANVVATMGLYDEAAEILRDSFGFKDGQIETYLAGHLLTHNESFIDLLAPERKASIYQPTAADSAANSKMLRDLLALDAALADASIDETVAAKAARDFGSSNDSMKTYRQIYAANRLLKKSTALPTALELVEEAKRGVDSALNVPVATTAVQAEELRDLRANALATGNVPDVEEAQRSALSNLLRGRVEDLTGWVLFNQDKYPEAIDHLKRAAGILPYGTPAWRNTTWHLAVAYEQTGSNKDALENYINSYNSGVRDPIRRAVIEKLYRKVNGSLYGLDDKIGPAPLTGAAPSQPAPTPATTPASSPGTAPSQPTTDKPADTSATAVAKPEATTTATPEPTPSATQASPQSEPISDEALKSAASRIRSNIKITGRVVDSTKTGIANVVVVLISPSGSVLSATTDNEGRYSFTVIPSQKSYRLIPSKDGYTFAPLEKTFAGLIDDQKAIDFVGSSGQP
jgi:tetratricopeptide (TPR) repeat protein